MINKTASLAIAVVASLAVGFSAARLTQTTPPPEVQVVETVDLKMVLPYYNEDAPDWCAEDMVCWIGSNADGRTDDEIRASLKQDIIDSSRVYAQ